MSWITTIADKIDSVFSMVRPALQAIPPLLLLCEVKNRPGLSAIVLTSSFIRRFPEAAIETGVNNCGTPNKINQFARICCEEIIKELKDNALVTCAIGTNVINSLGTGGNEGGPVVVTSVNMQPFSIDGITQ